MLDQSAIDTRRGQPVSPQKLFIDGAWCDSEDGATRDVVSPIDGEIITTLAEATPAVPTVRTRSARRQP